MKKMILSITLMLLVSLNGFSQTDMIPKVAVVDINAVYQAANANSDAVKKIIQLQEKHRNEIKKQQEVIDEMKERLAEAEESGDRSKIRDLTRRISVRENDLKNYTQRANNEIKEANEQMKSDPALLNLIRRAIQIVADRRGYSLVLSSSASGLVHWSPRIDITKEVIDTVATLQKVAMAGALLDQYFTLKAKSGDALLFFRLGDFYELFADDALLVSNLLGITLTQRSNTPMCGVPHHASESYIAKLVQLGYKVAVAEQVHKPEKGIAERAIVEVISPATAVARGASLLSNQANYMISFYQYKEHLAVALLDVARGDFLFAHALVDTLSEQVIAYLYRYGIVEMAVEKKLWSSLPELQRYCKEQGIIVNLLDEWHFVNPNAVKLLQKHFHVNDLSGFGLNPYERYLGVATALLVYLQGQLNDTLVHISSLRLVLQEEQLWMDHSSFRNLEITHNQQDGGDAYTLLKVLNQTCTVLGARKLREVVVTPLQNLSILQARQARIEQFYQSSDLLKPLREELKGIYDLERLNTKIMLSKAHAKDFIALAKSLQRVANMRGLRSDFTLMEAELATIAQMLAIKIFSTLMDEPSTEIQSGGVIRAGFDDKLDSLRDLAEHSRERLEAYAQQEREACGVPLRLKENRQLGWFFEVNKAHIAKLDTRFVRRQSVVGGERYITMELKELEERIASAHEEAVELERALFAQLREDLLEYFSALQEIAQEIADIDLFSSLANVAIERQYVRPQLKASGLLRIDGGRHPIVEHYSERPFVANDVHFADEHRLLLITGPNMAGKSTYLRMSALIVYMAHLGMFVPARSAEIPICDRIFCRVGASDNLSRGQSTFLVEMSETARILHYASSRSLVIVDEVGRGTGSDDGLAIARAILEHLALKTRSFTLFATHYHELTALRIAGYKNISLRVIENGEEIFFTNEIMDGAASGSYGLHVARMAGIPPIVLARAKTYLIQLDGLKGSDVDFVVDSVDVSPKEEELFSKEEILSSQILNFNLEQQTPLEAMQFLAKLQKEARRE